MDDFEKAILITFNQTGGGDASLKQQAELYCENIKRSSDSWLLFIQGYSGSNYTEVKFWCLQALHDFVSTQYRSTQPQARLQTKQAVLSWLRSTTLSFPLFLRNKLAQILVLIFSLEFPTQWPTFFNDLLALLPDGPNAVDMVCRVLNAVDEDIISLDIPRSQEDSKRSMLIKDAMREGPINDIVDAWYNLVVTYHTSHPELAASVLETLERYVSWIEISLIVNDKFIPLLFALVSSQAEVLQGAAADVLTEVISKRMEPVAKLTLVHQLNVVSLCSSWGDGLTGEEDGQEELQAKFAKLLSTVVSEVLESYKKVENSLVSLAAVGLVVADDAAREADSAIQLAEDALSKLFLTVLKVLQLPSDEVCMTVIPFLSNYVGRLKTAQKRNSGLTAAEKQHIPGILQALAVSAKYPLDSSNYATVPASQAEASAAEEEDSTVAEKRHDLFSLFKNTAKLMADEVYSFVGSLLQSVMSNASERWQDVEVAISLLYQLGEGATEEALKPSSGALGQLCLALVQTDIPCLQHRLVALSVMETLVRYYRVLQQEQQYLPRVLSIFLGSSGIGHPSEQVCRRACYLFCRLVKPLRQNLKTYIPSILQQLEPFLSRVVATPQTAQHATKSAATSKATATLPSAPVDDRLYAFESVGILLAQEDLQPEQQVQLFTMLLKPLLDQIDHTLTQLSSPGQTFTIPPSTVLQHTIEAITRISKGIGLHLCTKARPEIGALLVDALQTAVKCCGAMPTSKLVRAKFISLLHRLVECLGEEILRYLPTVLEVLLHANCDSQDLCDVLSLLTQLTTRFKTTMKPMLQQVLPVCVARVHLMLDDRHDWSGKCGLPSFSTTVGRSSSTATGITEEMRERAELQKAYYSFLHCVAHNQLAGLVLDADSSTLQVVMADLQKGAVTHVDSVVKKTCLQVFERLANEFSAGSSYLPGLREYLMDSIGGEVCIRGVFESNFDLQDAASMSFLMEVATALKLLYSKFGEDFLVHVCADVLQKAGYPTALQEQIVLHIRSSEPKQLREMLKGILQQIAVGDS